MRLSARAASVIFLFVLPFSASAQQSTSSSSVPPTSDPQAVAVLSQSLAAVVGTTPVSDVTLTGTAERIAGSIDEAGNATLTALPGGYSKVILALPSGARIEIRNASGVPLSDALPPGTTATVSQTPQAVGAWSGSDGVLHPMAGHNLMTDATWFFPAFILSNLNSSQGYTLSYIGKQTLNGQSVLHISASESFPPLTGVPTQVATLGQHLTQIDLYFNPTTLLPVAFGFNTHPDSDALLDLPVLIQFSNYQSNGGAMVPLHVQRFLNNGLVLDLQFTNIDLNSGLTSASFQLQ